MDIIHIGHITSYLARNVSHGLHSLVLVVDMIYIGYTTQYLARNVCSIFHIYSSSESAGTIHQGTEIFHTNRWSDSLSTIPDN